MIRVNQVKLPVSHSEADLRKKTAKMMGVSADQIQSVELVRQSLDARKKPDLYYLYALDVAVAGKEAAIVKRARSVNVQIRKEEAYRLPDPGNRAASGTTGNRGLWSGRYVLWSDVGACRISPAYSGTGAGCGQPCKGSCTLLDRWNAGSGVQCAVRRGRCRYVFRWKAEYAGQGSVWAE